MKNVTNYNVYESIHELPIMNYIHYYKYSQMINAIYFDHDKMINVFESTKNKEAKQIIERNKLNMQSMDRRGINLVLMGFLCLTDTVKIFTDNKLIELSNNIPKEQYNIIYNEFRAMTRVFKSEMIDTKVTEGYYLDDNETPISREESLLYSELKVKLLNAMKKGFDMELYNEAISNTFHVSDASEISFNSVADMNKSLMILRRENYQISTAYDFLISAQIFSEAAKKA